MQRDGLRRPNAPLDLRMFLVQVRQPKGAAVTTRGCRKFDRLEGPKVRTASVRTRFRATTLEMPAPGVLRHELSKRLARGIRHAEDGS